jgi:hypothetical protein
MSTKFKLFIAKYFRIFFWSDVQVLVTQCQLYEIGVKLQKEALKTLREENTELRRELSMYKVSDKEIN